MSGIIGIYGIPEAVRVIVLGLYGQQHRGQGLAGIVTCQNNRLYAFRGVGLADEVFSEKAQQQLPGDMGIGEIGNRFYDTDNRGPTQPFTLKTKFGDLGLCANSGIPKSEGLRERLLSRGVGFSSTSNTELLLNLLAMKQESTLLGAIKAVMQELEGGYAFILLCKDALYAVRDPRGIRPLHLGRIGNAIVTASETSVFTLIDAENIGEVGAGEIVVIDSKGINRIQGVKPLGDYRCSYEGLYAKYPNALYRGDSSASTLRHKLGERLATEHKAVNADYVISVSDAANSAAVGYAQESGTPFRIGLVPNHYAHRLNRDGDRTGKDLHISLNPISDLIWGKSIVVIDESIIRGITMKFLVKELFGCGAEEVHLRITSPLLLRTCPYGINMPKPEEFLSLKIGTDLEKIREHLGATSLEFLSLEEYQKVCGSACTYCFGGPDPLI